MKLVLLVVTVWTGLSVLLGFLVGKAIREYQESPAQPDSKDLWVHLDHQGSRVHLGPLDHQALSDHPEWRDNLGRPAHPGQYPQN